ncbi:MAG: GNAT family N-acetyltransferase [Pseudomonadota bacterium]
MAVSSSASEKLTLRRRLSDWLSGKRSRALHFEALEHPPEEMREKVLRGLKTYNDQFLTSKDRVPVGVFVRDDAGRIRGGATGQIAWDWLHVELLWVDDGLRNDGIGSRLLAQIERMALSRGVYRFRLSTASFQAREFYQKQGYEVFAILEDSPPGHTDYSMKKIIDLSGGEN